jgi:hypothetical protein
MKSSANLGLSASRAATLPPDNAALIGKLAQQVDKLSGQVAALFAVIVTQPATNFSSVEEAKSLVRSLSVERLNPAPGSASPLDHAIATIDRIASQAAAVSAHDPGD